MPFIRLNLSSACLPAFEVPSHVHVALNSNLPVRMLASCLTWPCFNQSPLIPSHLEHPNRNILPRPPIELLHHDLRLPAEICDTYVVCQVHKSFVKKRDFHFDAPMDPVEV